MKKILSSFTLGTLLGGLLCFLVLHYDLRKENFSHATMMDVDTVGFRLIGGETVFVIMKRDPDYISQEAWGWVYVFGGADMGMLAKTRISNDILEAETIIMEASSNRDQFFLRSPDVSYWLEYTTGESKIALHETPSKKTRERIFIRADVKIHKVDEHNQNRL